VLSLTESPWVRLPLVVLVVLSLQQSLLTELRIFGVAGDLMLLIAIVSGLVAGAERGAAAAFFVGIMFDLTLQTPFGLSALAYSVTAYAVGVLQTGYLRTTWWIGPLQVLVASAAATVLYAVLATLFGAQGIITSHLLTVILVVSLVNALLSPLAAAVMRWALVPDGPRLRRGG
jgi:rod shape-determining protein MreD